MHITPKPIKATNEDGAGTSLNRTLSMPDSRFPDASNDVSMEKPMVVLARTWSNVLKPVLLEVSVQLPGSKLTDRVFHSFKVKCHGFFLWVVEVGVVSHYFLPSHIAAFRGSRISNTVLWANS